MLARVVNLTKKFDFCTGISTISTGISSRAGMNTSVTGCQDALSDTLRVTTAICKTIAASGRPLIYDFSSHVMCIAG